MCLIPMGGEGMNMQPRFPSNPQAKAKQQQLYVIAVCHAVLAVLLMVANPFVGLFEFMDVCILYCAATSMEFCLLIFYILLCCLSMVQYISGVGLVIQEVA